MLCSHVKYHFPDPHPALACPPALAQALHRLKRQIANPDRSFSLSFLQRDKSQALVPFSFGIRPFSVGSELPPTIFGTKACDLSPFLVKEDKERGQRIA